MAFTRWLTAKYRDACLIGADEEIRLPTEVEWEYTARETDERRYPYGDKFEATKGNTGETGIGQTSAVGLFPDGASPFDVLDMSGNVWEWCLNKYREPEVVAVDDSGDSRVLRGGSFLSLLIRAAASYRFNYSPNSRDYDFGFRVVVGSAPIEGL